MDAPAPLGPYHRGAPAMPAVPTLRGVLLEPGERVVYYHHTKNVATRIVCFLMGIPLVVILIGLVMLWVAFTDQSETHAVTTRRYIRIKGKKPAEVMGLREVARHESRWTNRTRMGNRFRSEFLLFDASGRRLVFGVLHDDVLGPLVVRLLEDPDAAQALPPVAYEP